VGGPSELKRCAVDPSHLWTAAIPFCPYCNLSSDARVWYAEQERERQRAEKRRELQRVADASAN
jgi:hypothetical protein